MAVSEFVTFTVQVNNAGVSQRGYGTPLLVSYDATWPERTRTYSEYADVLDDFDEGTPEALVADAVFSQSPHPIEFKIGRGALPPTQQYTIGAIVVANSTPYEIQVDGPDITSTLASYTSDSGATIQEIHNGLVTALNAVVGNNYSATFAPINVGDKTFTATNATETLNIASHGLQTGDGPVRVFTTGVLPVGLTAGTDYWVIRTGTGTLQLASSLANALAGTAVSFSTDGSGTNTLSDSAYPAYLDLDTPSTNCNTVIKEKTAGAAGNSTTIAFVADGTGAGTLNESAYPTIVFHYQSGVTTVTNFETAVTASTHLAVKVAGTGANILANPGDTFTATNLAGGYDALDTLSPYLPFLVTADAAGDWFSLEVQGDAALLSNKESHSDPGIATDLAAIAQADEDWYCLLTNFNSKAVVQAAAAWVEANSRIYVVSVTDTDALNTSAGNGDTLDALFTLGYRRTDGKYHPSPAQCFGAASAGVILPLNPGKWTEFGKTLVGVSPVHLTATQRTNLRARRAGTYTTEKGRSITWDGKVFDTVYGYLDIVVAVDWLTDQVVSAAFGTMISLSKVAYTDEDIDLIASAVRGVLHDAVSDAHQVLDPGDLTDPTNLPPTIVFPKVSTISAGTRALRKLPNGTIKGRLQGAVQSVDFIATLTF